MSFALSLQNVKSEFGEEMKSWDTRLRYYEFGLAFAKLLYILIPREDKKHSTHLAYKQYFFSSHLYPGILRIFIKVSTLKPYFDEKRRFVLSGATFTNAPIDPGYIAAEPRGSCQ